MSDLLPAVILYAKDPEKTRRFYEAVGLVFKDEQHEDGPVHVVCTFEGFILEIYPDAAGRAVRCGPGTRLAFPVASMTRTASRLKRLGGKPRRVKDSEKDKVFSIEDPDGRRVHIFARGRPKKKKP